MQRGAICLVVSLVMGAAAAWATTAVGSSSAMRNVSSHESFLVGDRSLAAAPAVAPRGRAEAFRFTAASSGTVSHIAIYVGPRSHARRVAAALYADRAGRPRVRLTQGAVHLKRRGWAVVSVRPIRIQRSRTYWVALLGHGGNLALRGFRKAGCHAIGLAHRAALPRSWRGGRRVNTCRVSAYALGSIPGRAPIGSAAAPDGTVATTATPVAPTSGDQSASGIAVPVSLTTPTVTTPTVPLPVPNPLAPQNTAPPVISGTTVAGKKLTVSNGTWYDASSYAYQWQDCNASGAGCTPIKGATSNAYTLGSGDVNHTIRAAVTASNLLASSTATSNPTAVVTQPTPPPPPPPPPPSSCFSSPSSCGYPSYSGGIGANCSSLPAWSPSNLPAGDGSVSGHQVTITANNVTISGYNIGDYFFYVEGSHFTLNNDCISFNAANWSGGSATATTVWGTSGSSYLTVTNSTIVPPGCSVSPLSVCTGSSVNQTLITSGGAPYATIKNDVLAGAVEDLNSIGDNSTIEGNYIVANGAPGGNIHSEAMFEQDVTGLTIDHNVLLNPMDQSAVIFAQVGNNGPCDNKFTITNNLIAGGGWPLSLCTHAGSAGTSSMTITGNHFARCSGSSNYDSSTGGRYCGTTAPSSGTSVDAGADSHGYWPNGGFFGLTDSMYCTSPGWTWSNNVWDDNGAATSCS